MPMDHMPMKSSSLYIHVPYCRRKCIYCDFFSGGASIADWRRYVDAAVSELSVRRDELPGVVESIYFGGGTPSLIPTPEWRRLIEGVVAVIGSDSISECCEITLEANPEDVDPATVGEWIAGGVNRVSLGVQSFNDTLLKSVGRHHSGDEAAAALSLLKESIDNVSADLIFGLPGQTEAQLADDVDRLISLAPSHVSLYSLMYEEGTALTALRDAGRIGEIDDEVAARMFRLITDRLRAAGYSRYEISNYSLPGYESRHNSGYWWGRPYLGIGPGAHSYDGDRIRRWNPRDIRGWLDTYAPCWRDCDSNSDDARLTEGSSAGDSSTGFATECELLTDHELAEEMIMLSLRTSAGLPTDRYASRFGADALSRLMWAAAPLIKAGSMEIDGDRLRITDSGIMTADRLIVGLLPD